MIKPPTETLLDKLRRPDDKLMLAAEGHAAGAHELTRAGHAAPAPSRVSEPPLCVE